jgi:hypothetical protein
VSGQTGWRGGHRLMDGQVETLSPPGPQLQRPLKRGAVEVLSTLGVGWVTKDHSLAVRPSGLSCFGLALGWLAGWLVLDGAGRCWLWLCVAYGTRSAPSRLSQSNLRFCGFLCRSA